MPRHHTILPRSCPTCGTQFRPVANARKFCSLDCYRESDRRTPLNVRFWSKVDKRAPDECWLWTGGKSQGYGHILENWDSRRTLSAHRVSYEIAHGPIPIGLQIDHLCRTPACVNPAHLEAVTQRENGLRGINPAAVNAKKTHCPNGHPFEGENIVWVRNKGKVIGRLCRICKYAYNNEQKAKRSASKRSDRNAS